MNPMVSTSILFLFTLSFSLFLISSHFVVHFCIKNYFVEKVFPLGNVCMDDVLVQTMKEEEEGDENQLASKIRQKNLNVSCCGAF